MYTIILMFVHIQLGVANKYLIYYYIEKVVWPIARIL